MNGWVYFIQLLIIILAPGLCNSNDLQEVSYANEVSTVMQFLCDLYNFFLNTRT